MVAVNVLNEHDSDSSATSSLPSCMYSRWCHVAQIMVVWWQFPS